MDIIIKRVAAKTGKSNALIKNVHKHIMFSVYDTIRSGTHRNILLNGFCKFVVKPKRKEILDRITKHGIKNNGNDSQTPTETEVVSTS